MAYRTQTFAFGPGSLESVTLKVYTHRRDQEHLVARLEGTYTVYCGAGNSHTVSINEQMHGFEPKQPVGCLLTAYQQLEFDRWMSEAYRGVEGAARMIADQLIEWALDGWNDPCSEFEEV